MHDAPDPMTCDEMVRALWAYLDRAVDPVSMERIDAHLGDCVHCRSHAEFERTLLDHIRALRREHDEPEVLRERVLELLERATEN